MGGFQALYTDIFATPGELRQMFDFSLLDAARDRLACDDAFPAVYDKVKSEAGISDLSAEIAAEEKLFSASTSARDSHKLSLARNRRIKHNRKLLRRHQGRTT